MRIAAKVPGIGEGSSSRIPHEGRLCVTTGIRAHHSQGLARKMPRSKSIYCRVFFGSQRILCLTRPSCDAYHPLQIMLGRLPVGLCSNSWNAVCLSHAAPHCRPVQHHTPSPHSDRFTLAHSPECVSRPHPSVAADRKDTSWADVAVSLMLEWQGGADRHNHPHVVRVRSHRNDERDDDHAHRRHEAGNGPTCVQASALNRPHGLHPGNIVIGVHAKEAP